MKQIINHLKEGNYSIEGDTSPGTQELLISTPDGSIHVDAYISCTELNDSSHGDYYTPPCPATVIIYVDIERALTGEDFDQKIKDKEVIKLLTDIIEKEC